jgi:hypothetical protein
MRALVREALLSQSQVSRTVAILVDLGLLARHGAGARYPNPTRAHDVPDVDAARPEPRGDRAVAAVESLP